MRVINHPAKGSSIKVDPIRSLKDIKLIKKLLDDKPRDLALFVCGTNLNLRGSDLTRITVGHVKYIGAGEHFTLREKKTGKVRTITINKTVHEAIRRLLMTIPDAGDSEPLFQSRKGKQPLCVSYLNALVKGWCREINLKGNFGSHSLRKSWGYLMRTVHNVDIPTLMTMLNHSTQKQTLAYLGIQSSEIRDAYMCEI